MTKPKHLLLTAAVALLLTVSALTTAAETSAPTVTPTPIINVQNSNLVIDRIA